MTPYIPNANLRNTNKYPTYSDHELLAVVQRAERAGLYAEHTIDKTIGGHIFWIRPDANSPATLISRTTLECHAFLAGYESAALIALNQERDFIHSAMERL